MIGVQYRVKVWFWIGLFFCFFQLANAQEQVQSALSSTIDWSNLPYADGEELTYKVYYNWSFIWIPAGEVRFKVKEHSDHLEYTITGRSFSSYDKIFKVRDYYLSQVNKESLLPYNFKRDILEGKYVRFDSLSIDQSSHKLKEYFGRTRADAKEFEFQLDDVVHDMVSVIYHLRSQKVSTMKTETRLPMRIFFDKEFFALDVVYKGVKTKRIKSMGKQQVYHLQPELIDGYVFSKGNLMDIWAATDGSNVPLLIESPISFGSVKAILTSVKKDHSSSKEKL